MFWTQVTLIWSVTILYSHILFQITIIFKLFRTHYKLILVFICGFSCVVSNEHLYIASEVCACIYLFNSLLFANRLEHITLVWSIYSVYSHMSSKINNITKLSGPHNCMELYQCIFSCAYSNNHHVEIALCILHIYKAFSQYILSNEFSNEHFVSIASSIHHI